MPNWCTTNITLAAVGEKGKKCLFDLSKKLLDQLNSENNFVKNDFGPGWLGNIAILFNMTTIPEALEDNFHGYNCRGSITCVNEDLEEVEEYGSLNLTQEDAWDPNLNIWLGIINKYYLDENGIPLIQLYYQAEESGMGLYYTNDDIGRFYPDNYCIDISIDHIEPNDFPFYTQKPNSPFIKVNQNIDPLILSNPLFITNGSKLNGDLSPLPPAFYEMPNLSCYYYCREQEALRIGQLMFPEVNNMEELNNKVSEYIDKNNNAYIGINQYVYCSAEDANPLPLDDNPPW